MAADKNSSRQWQYKRETLINLVCVLFQGLACHDFPRNGILVQGDVNELHRRSQDRLFGVWPLQRDGLKLERGRIGSGTGLSDRKPTQDVRQADLPGGSPALFHRRSFQYLLKTRRSSEKRGAMKKVRTWKVRKSPFENRERKPFHLNLLHQSMRLAIKANLCSEFFCSDSFQPPRKASLPKYYLTSVVPLNESQSCRPIQH